MTEASLSKGVTPGTLPRYDQGRRFVVHIPFEAPGLEAALAFADRLADVLAFLPAIDPGGTTASYEDDQNARHFVKCDRKIPGRKRCQQRSNHADDCR